MNAPLYNREILALAVENIQYPRLAGADLTGEVRAPICGSTLRLDLVLDDEGAIDQLGMQAEACALGQAAASLFARHAKGLKLDDIERARNQAAAWLGGADGAPFWPEWQIIAGVRGFSARHGAVMLPFDAAVKLMSSAQPA